MDDLWGHRGEGHHPHRHPRLPLVTSTPPVPPGLPHTWRPLGPRIAGAVAGGVLVVMMVFLWVGFDAETRAGDHPVPAGDRDRPRPDRRLGCLYALIRSRVDAETDRLIVVNGYRRHEFEWAEVIAVATPARRALGDPRPRRRRAPARRWASSHPTGSGPGSAVRDLRALLDRPAALTRHKPCDGSAVWTDQIGAREACPRRSRCTPLRRHPGNPPVARRAAPSRSRPRASRTSSGAVTTTRTVTRSAWDAVARERRPRRGAVARARR